MAATYPADTFQEGVDLTIEASNQLAQVVRGDAHTEVTVADGSTIPSIRKAQVDSMYFKEPEAWTTGQTETDYLQLKKYINPTTGKESWWFAKGAMVSSPIAMGTSPFGDDNWTLYTPEDLFISGKAEYESIYQALKGKAAEAGYNLVRGSFEEGGTLTNTNDVLWYQATGKYYNWYDGSAKTAAAGATPATSGGIGAGAWVDRTDVTLRSEIGAITKTFSSVVEMISDASLTIGEKVKTLSYHSGLYVGGNDYIIVAGGTGINDSGSFIDLNNGLQATGLFVGGVVNVCQFGATGDGITDDYAAIQNALSYSKSIFIPKGIYLVGNMLEVSDDIFEISGVKGLTFIKSKFGNNIIGPSGNFTAQYGQIKDISFCSSVVNAASAIYSPSDWYVSHWRIIGCSFQQNLAIGINANIIACQIECCDFGLYGRSAGQNHKAANIVGQLTPTIRQTNINTFRDCEFAYCAGDSVVSSVNGFKPIFEGCIFENNNTTTTIIDLDGMYYPVIDKCWFEGNSSQSFIRVGLDGAIDSVLLSITNSIFRVSGIITEMIDFSDTANKYVSFKNNLVSGGNIPFTASVGVKFVEHSGNYSTNTGYSARISDRVKMENGLQAASFLSTGDIIYQSKLVGLNNQKSATYLNVIADDSVATIDMTGNNRGFVDIFANGSDGIYAIVAQGASNLYTVALSPSVINAGSAALTGTTGTDGKLNIAKLNGTLYIENRLGASLSFVTYVRGGSA